jgi:hypothetical protein
VPYFAKQLRFRSGQERKTRAEPSWSFRQYPQATSKTKRLAQDKLVDAILPTVILPKTNLIQ